jgi:2-amino-4,5-dihydroxy-6-oxo-7-(phosphooxy)heptanoate synthase
MTRKVSHKVHPFHGRSHARSLRIRRLYRHHPQRILAVPLDHSLTDGSVSGGGSGLNNLVGQLAANGADAVILHKGSVRYINPESFMHTSLIIHLSASTIHAPDPDAKFLVANVEEALRLGADAVSVHVNFGSGEEARQIGDMATVADACDRWNVPLLAMMYPRGAQFVNPMAPEIVAHAVTVATDMGADLIKTYYVGSEQDMTEITASCPVPIIVAGASQFSSDNALLSLADAALRGGAAGMAVGRGIFQSRDPGATTCKLARRIHSNNLCGAKNTRNDLG